MAGDVVGREAELAELSGLLSPGDGLRVGVLTGEPGSGKSTVVDVIVERARAAGHQVLMARPRPAERSLAYSGLADLLETVPELDSVDLPAPQRRALRRALLLEGDEPDGQDEAAPRAVAAAVRTLLSRLAVRQPVLLVVDDAHWLDEATTTVLAYAARRLVTSPLALLVSTRPVAQPVDWPAGSTGHRVEIVLAGLPAAALFHLVRDRLGAALDRPTLARLTEVSGGNPMYALELARATGADGSAGGWTPLTPTLDALVGEAVRRLPSPSRAALLVAALARDPRPDLVVAACDLDRASLAEVLGPAEAADVARVEQGRVRFRHPLFSTAVVADAGPEDVAATHRILAGLEDEVETAARHLALATETPDHEVADRLDTAAGHARERGAHGAARELAALALAKTPPGSGAESTRRLRLAEWSLHDGDPETSRRAVEPLTDAGGADGARAHLLLAGVAQLSSTIAEVGRHARAALDLAGADHVLLRTRALLLLADTFEDAGASIRYATEARLLLQAAAAADERERLLVSAMQLEAHARILSGDRRGMDLLHEAVVQERGRVWDLVVSTASFALAQQLLFASRLEEARDRLTTLLELARVRGDEASEPMLLLNLGHLENRAARFDASERHAREAMELAGLTRQAIPLELARAQVAEHEGRRGELTLAMEHLDGCAEAATELGDSWLQAIVSLIAGRLHLAAGAPQRAVDDLRAASGHAAAAGLVDPGWHPYPAELAEALLAAGEVDAAESEIAALHRDVGDLERPHLHAAVPRARAQLLALRGDLPQALAQAQEALRRQHELSQDFEVARTRLVLGRLHRRAKQKRLAHDALTQAAVELDRLGAPLWAEQARRELARVGLRRAAPETLTETEARVATLAAAGRTNREIATEVFVSPKTVEGILGRVYRKLGVRSRVELVSALRHTSAGRD